MRRITPAPGDSQDPGGRRRIRGLFTRACIQSQTRVTSYSGSIKDPCVGPVRRPIDISYYRSINQGQVPRVIDGFRDPRPGFGMGQFANDPQGDDKNATSPSPNCTFELDDQEGKIPQVYLVTSRIVGPGPNSPP